MNKDATISDLIARIQPIRRNWCVVDHWEADLFAIGIARADNQQQLVYISTYNRDPGRYDYECEASPTAASTKKAKAEDVGFDTLLSAIEKHLG